MAKKIIMSWSKCKIEVGKTGDDDAMASELTDIGTINDQSTTLATEDGNKLTATATGGVVVAEEEGEPVVTLTTRVKEMDFDKEGMFTGAKVEESSGDLVVKTNVVSDDFSVKLTPKNIGSIGIKVRRTHVSFRPGSSETEGNYVDITFKVLACEDGELYRKFRVKAADWANTAQLAAKNGEAVGQVPVGTSAETEQASATSATAKSTAKASA